MNTKRMKNICKLKKLWKNNDHPTLYKFKLMPELILSVEQELQKLRMGINRYLIPKQTPADNTCPFERVKVTFSMF